MLIVLGIDHRRPGPFTKREDDVRRTSRRRGRSHSFWIPESRSYGRSISCHVALKSIRESSKGKDKGMDLQGYREDRKEPSIFRTQLFKNSPASPPSLCRVASTRISQEENSPPSLSLIESLSCFPRKKLLLHK